MELPALCRVVKGWPGWLMLVAQDRRVLARSSALTLAFGALTPPGRRVDCTQLVNTAGPGNCCLDYVDAAARPGTWMLVRTPVGSGAPPALCMRMEPVSLTYGARAWLAYLEPYEVGLQVGVADPWGEVVALRRRAYQKQATWLAQLTQRWVQPLVRARWAGWLCEGTGRLAECRAASGRLDGGLTQAMLNGAASAALRAGDARGLPLTLPGVRGGEWLHLVPSGPAPGWVLVLVGGRVDGARAAMLRSLVAAVAAIEAGARSSCPDASQARGAATQQGLTAREAEVVELVAHGLPDKCIAQHLGLSFHTVRNHLRRVMSKLGVNRRAQIAFSLASRTGAAAASTPGAVSSELGE